MVRLDCYISGIWDGTILKDLECELLAYDNEGEIIAVKYQGVYVIVDNGYIAWSCTVPPYTDMSTVTKFDGHSGWSQCGKMLSVLLEY